MSFVHPTIACPDINVNIDPKQIQPNAIDITIDKVWMLRSNTPYIRMVDSKIEEHADRIPIPADLIINLKTFKEEKVFTLIRGESYQFESNLKIIVPDNCLGWLVPRSSLNRNAINIFSGLYDSGFIGTIGGVIRSNLVNFQIEYGSRVAQFVMATMETGHVQGQYQGQYQGV